MKRLSAAPPGVFTHGIRCGLIIIEDRPIEDTLILKVFIDHYSKLSKEPSPVLSTGMWRNSCAISDC